MKDEAMFLTVVQLWAAAAWADGVIAPNERRLLQGLIEGADVSDAVRATALGYLDQKVSLDDTRMDSLDDRERKGVYRAACKLTTVDRNVDDSERAFLQRLRERLGLDAATAAEIEKAMSVSG